MNKADFIERLRRLASRLPGRKSRHGYRNPRRYRLNFVSENTFNSIWSLRLTRAKVIVGAVGIVAAVGSLIAVIFLFTPVGKLLPGPLKGDLRARYTDAAVRIDSLARVARVNEAYTRNVVGILRDSVAEDNIPADLPVAASPAQIDTLPGASEAERLFVQQFEEAERFNLSVLSPIAAEGMLFEPPTRDEGGAGPVAAVHRGTVVGLWAEPDGCTTVAVQHPNDFLSVYSGLAEVYTAKGAKVAAGQRIGLSKAARPLKLELWHNGTPLDPAEYVGY